MKRLLIFWCCCWPAFLCGQDVFGVEASRAFVLEKYQQKNFGLALRACRDAGTRFPELDFRQTYFRICVAAGAYTDGVQTFADWYPEPGLAPASLRQKYVGLLVLERDWAQAESWLSRPGFLLEQHRDRFALQVQLMQVGAVPTLEDLRRVEPDLDGPLTRLAREKQELKFKRPFLGALASGMLPGLGQVYAGQPADGLSALLSVGLCGWGAYRFFSKKGPGNLLAWGLTGLGATFYLANISGGRRAVQRYNEKTHGAYQSKVESLVRAGL